MRTASPKTSPGLARFAKPQAPALSEGAALAAPYRRTSLRNAAINYRAGWWAVTMSVAKNKSLLGAIVGEEVRLNALGRFVEETWRSLPARYPELELFDFVVMPNHFHALLRIHSSPTNREHHLGFLVGRFKGATSHRYGEMRRAGEIEDIGDALWQRDYWDDLVTSEAEFAGWQRYIRENPKNWSRDRYGACTAYSRGDVALLNAPRVAFVASAGFSSAVLRPRRLRATKVARFDKAEADNLSKGAASAAPNQGEVCREAKVLISTFTSPQEREALRRALAKKKRLIAVFPAGIPATLSPALDAAIREGRALAVSPQPPDSRLNKKIATWCNEFVLRNADEIWVGEIAPNGMLAQMLSGLSVFEAGGLSRPKITYE
jgi:putative transposase